MSRRTRSSEEEEEFDDEEEQEETPKVRGRRRHRGEPEGVKAWKRSAHSGALSGERRAARSAERRARYPVFYRARDSLYFEPLVALAIVVLLLVSLFAYTQNWPPLYVVESSSMQHGSNWKIGLINTGDIVLAKQAPESQITTYVSGAPSGYQTYGEFGDVILYHPDGQGGPTPIIHRAILYIGWNPDGTYDLAQLQRMSCGSTPNPVYATPGTSTGCGTSEVSGTLDLYRIGWQSVTVSFNLTVLGSHSGFLTMGDNNIVGSGTAAFGVTDQQAGVSTLVDPSWIIGVARGIIPWFGATKLLFEGQAGMVPAQTWELMGITIAAVLLAAIGIHLAFRAEGVEDPRRKAEESAERREAAEDRRRNPHAYTLRPWEDEEDDGEGAAPRRRFFGRSRPVSGGKGHHGRPRPTVRKNSASKAHHKARRHDRNEEL